MNETGKKRLYTEEGIVALKERLNSFIKIFNGEDKNFKYATELMLLGFGPFIIETREECLHRITELSELTGTNLRMLERVEVLENGKQNVEYKVEIK